MIDFRPLASSSSGCAYHLSGGGAAAPLLVECGIPFKQLQRALAFKVSELAGCLVSHAHGDHSMCAMELRGRGVEVRASLETWDALGLKSNDCAHFLHPRSESQVGDWRVLPFEAVHDCPGTLGFVIGAPSGERLLYLTDSMYSPFRFDGLTHLAVECNYSSEIIRERTREGTVHRERYARTVRTHMSIERLEEMLKANDLSKVERIWLLHLSDANSDENEFKSRIERLTGIPTTIAPAWGELCEARR